MKKNKYTVEYIKTLPKFRQKTFLKKKQKFVKFSAPSQRLFLYQSYNPNFKYYSIKSRYDRAEIKEAEKLVEKSKKNKKTSLIFFIINILIIGGIVIYNICTGDLNFENFPTEWKYIKYLLLAVVMALASTIIDTIKYIHLIYVTTKRIRPFLALKVNLLGKYYDNVTPLATGGQPFQIYYLNKRSVKGESATSIPLAKYIFWQIAHICFSGALLIFNSSTYFQGNAVIVSAATIGLVANAALMLIILFLSVSKRIAPRIVIGVLKFLSKIKIIKNYRATFRKVMKFVMGYQKCMRSIVKKPTTVIIQLILALAEIISYCLIAHFVYLAFLDGNTAVSFIEICVKVIVCQLAVSFIPTPGSTGAAEYSFLEMFKQLIGVNYVIAMLIWRLLTYYLALLQGLIVIVYDIIIGNRKAEHLEKIGFFKTVVEKVEKRKIVEPTVKVSDEEESE